MSSGSIIKRQGKRGVSWLLKYDGPRDPATGKRRQLYKTIRGPKMEAERELRRLLGQLDDGTHVDPHKLTVAEWCQIWLRDHAGPTVAAKTLEEYDAKLRLRVIPRIGMTHLLRLSAPAIQAMYSELLASGRRPRKGTDAAGQAPTEPSGLSPQTVLHVHRVLSEALSAAVRQRVLSRNPADDVTPPRPDAAKARNDDGSSETRALERDQLETLLAGFKGRPLFPVVAMAAATGMRRGEILALRWSDVNFERGTIRIDRAIEDTKAHGIRVKATKTKGSRRTIGIDAGLLALLRAEWKRHAEIALSLGVRLGNDALVFPGSAEAPTTPRAPDGVSKAFAKRAKQLGFKDLRLHDLRHTHATLLLLAGVPINAVSQRLGHSNPVVTLTVYGHVLRRAEDQAVSVAGSLLQAALAEQ